MTGTAGSAGAQPPRWTRSDSLCAAICLLLAVGAFLPSIPYGFTYDDVHIIRDRAVWHSLANWRIILTTTWWADAVYRPVSALWLAFDWSLSGGRPAWFHAVNVVLHGAVSVLVFLLARNLGTRIAAFAAAALFAVHPVHVEAVANIVGRAELVAALGSVGAVLLYRWDGKLADRGDHGPRRATAAMGTMGAVGIALGAKEGAFAVAGLLLLSDWLDAWRDGASLGSRLRRHWMLWAASVALTGEFLWLWLRVVGDLSGGGAAPGMMGAGMVSRAVVMAPMVLEYLRLLVFPLHLSADYSPDYLPVSATLGLRGVLGIGVVVALVAVGIMGRKRLPDLTFGLAWLGGTILIVSNVLVPTEVLVAERTLYLPSVGAVVAAAALAARAHGRWRAPAVGAVAFLSGLGLWRTLTREPVWRDNATFFPALVADAPGSFRSYWVAGALAVEAGDSTRGEALMRQAILTYPLHAGLWADLASLFERRGRWREAATYFRTAFRLDSTRIDHAAYAVADYLRSGEADSAEALLDVALRVAPDHPILWQARGDLLAATGEPRAALGWRRRLALRFPGVARYWAHTVDAALAVGDCTSARQALERLGAARHVDSAFADADRRLRAICGSP